jgi:glutamate racemase
MKKIWTMKQIDKGIGGLFVISYMACAVAMIEVIFGSSNNYGPYAFLTGVSLTAGSILRTLCHKVQEQEEELKLVKAILYNRNGADDGE